MLIKSILVNTCNIFWGQCLQKCFSMLMGRCSGIATTALQATELNFLDARVALLLGCPRKYY